MTDAERSDALTRELYATLSRKGLLPTRGPSGSIRNAFRATAVQTARRVAATKFRGDVRALIDALNTEWPQS
jgi:hypothetical protein